jgi:hypothetical protein
MQRVEEKILFQEARIFNYLFLLNNLRIMKKKLFIIAVVSVFTVPFSASAATTTDYINQWAFDEGAGLTVSDAVGGKNGTITGSSTGFGWASGKSKTAIGMDGTAGTGVVLPNDMLTGSAGTISVWFKYNSRSDHNIIFSARSTNTRYIYMTFLADMDGRPTIEWRETESGNIRRAQASKPLDINTWYHVTLATDSSGWHAYVNGEEITMAGENTGRWLSSFTNHPLMYRIGTIDATLVGSLDGYIDDLRIYNRALSFEEAKSIYDTTNEGTPTVPLAIMPKIDFSISSDNVPFGGSVTINWSTTNITTCTASGGWSGDVPTSGSRTFTNLAASAAYTLSCSGKGGSVSSAVMVNVSGKDATTTPVGTITVEQTYGQGISQTMTPAERTAKIAELNALIKSLLEQVIALLQAQLKAKLGQ